MSADIIILPVNAAPVQHSRGAKRVLEQYFRDEGLKLRIGGDDVFNRVDHMLLWLLIEGYRVVPLEDEVTHG